MKTIAANGAGFIIEIDVFELNDKLKDYFQGAN